MKTQTFGVIEDVDTEEQEKVGLIAGVDFEGTLNRIEGADFLAGLRSKELQDAVSEITEQGMSGKITFEESLKKRFELIKPTLADIAKLQKAYLENEVPGAKNLITCLQKLYHRVLLISGGFRQAIIPAAEQLGLSTDEKEMWAMNLKEPTGKPLELPGATHPLYSNHGKGTILRGEIFQEKLKRDMGNIILPNLMIGDGTTDALTREDAGVYFISVGTREQVRKVADFCADSLNDIRLHLEELVRQKLALKKAA